MAFCALEDKIQNTELRDENRKTREVKVRDKEVTERSPMKRGEDEWDRSSL